jgi:hypothetical protein
LAIGIDACREALAQRSRKAPANAVFVIARAEALPAELAGRANMVIINFPWGSLLSGLLKQDSQVWRGIRSTAAGTGAMVEIRMNGEALRACGLELDEGAATMRRILQSQVVGPVRIVDLGTTELRQTSTTWAKRLAFGRDPRAVLIQASIPREGVTLQGPTCRSP